MSSLVLPAKRRINRQELPLKMEGGNDKTRKKKLSKIKVEKFLEKRFQRK